MVLDILAPFAPTNKPPVANAGADQTVECQGSHSAQVTLNGSKSTDPNGDKLDYRWTWDSGSATGAVVTVRLASGTHCATLTVRDPSGHMDRRVVTVTVADTTPPDLSAQLSPRVLWPANHKMVNIRATVHASDSCGSLAELKLLSIFSNQADKGSATGILNTTFGRRSERSTRIFSCGPNASVPAAIASTRLPTRPPMIRATRRQFRRMLSSRMTPSRTKTG